MTGIGGDPDIFIPASK